MFDLGPAIAHHLIIFALFGIFAVELVLVRRDMDVEAVKRVGSFDVWYGVLAAVIVVVGFVRAVFAAKGLAYYSHNAFFWAKMTTFVVVAMLSIAPTVRFVTWRRRQRTPAAAEVGRIRAFMYAEVAWFGLPPIFAAAMARGFGEF